MTFFHSSGNIPSFRHFLKMICNGLHVEFPHSFNICMLIMPRLWALLRSSFLIISPTWSAENWNDSKSGWVLIIKTNWIWLSFTRGVYCSTKYELKRLQFFLVSDKNLSLCNYVIYNAIKDLKNFKAFLNRNFTRNKLQLFHKYKNLI